MSNECIFCNIIRGQSPAEFVAKKEKLVVFKDIRPMAPIHFLIVPKKHIRSINDLMPDDSEIISEMIITAKEEAKNAGISLSGYKLIFHVERGGGQLIFHIHLHLIGGW
jgi:histidine triad (HIT) family protein